MSKTVFDYEDYKAYLLDYFKTRPGQGRGMRSALAEAIHCQTAYVSQVLNDSSDFSLEQADKINHFLGHSSEEAHFFLLLVQFSRAGTPSLRQVFHAQIQQVLERRLILKSRLKMKHSLAREDQAIYYSAWYYGVIHVMLSIPEFRKKETLSKYLRLPVSKVSEVLDFLVSVGLAETAESGFKIGTTQIHLERDSPLISKHHTNWRLQAIQSLDRGSPENLHYSSVVTLSKEDAQKIRSMLVKNLEETTQVIRDSPEEVVYCLAMDFFGVWMNQEGIKM